MLDAKYFEKLCWQQEQKLEINRKNRKTKIKPEKNQTRRSRTASDYFHVLLMCFFFDFFQIYFFVFVLAANITFQNILHRA